MTLLAKRYRVADEIGRGGMATVYRAADEILHRPVAVKMTTPQRASDTRHTRYLQSLRREALSGAQLAHPNVVRILDYGEQDHADARLPFVVMELVSGGTLTTRLNDEGAMSWRAAALICAQVAAGLSAAHRRGLVHRDLKPSNVMLSPSGAKIVDFGLSASTGDRQTDADGTLWGTAAYFAPEQLRGARARPGADVYALGLVLHACLTGRHAWDGRASDILSARAYCPTPRLPQSCDAPEAIASVYHRCLAPQPQKRPTAQRVARLLQEAVTPTPKARAGHRWVPDRRCSFPRRYGILV